MRFSKRIYSLRDAVKQGETVADIGTDHGYVPMLLIRDGISPYVIMSDISADSLSKARETFSIVKIPAEDSQFRVGDGLDTIENAEVDAIIIAGLGGHTISQILDADINKAKSFKRIIMQPRKHSGALRYWLINNGFAITEELLTSEGKFVCEIIIAEPKEGKNIYIDYPEGDIRWAYPETLRLADKELLNKRVGWKLGSIEEQIENLSNSINSIDQIEKLKHDYTYLNDLIEG